MSTDFLAALGSIEIDDEDDNEQHSRQDRMRTAFLNSKESYKSERIFTEAGWYSPPEIPPPSRLHVRNIDYTLAQLYLCGKFEDTLNLAVSQLDTGVDNDGKEGREKELLDISMRCAMKLNDTVQSRSLAERSRRGWGSSPALAATAAKAFLVAKQPHDALATILGLITARGALPPYMTTLSSILRAFAEIVDEPDVCNTIQSMLGLIQEHVRPFRPLFDDHPPNSDGRHVPRPESISVDEEAIRHFGRCCGLPVIVQERLIAVFASGSSNLSSHEEEMAPERSVRTL